MHRVCLLLIAVVMVACSKPPAPTRAPEAPEEPAAPVLKISVLKDGKILADGKETTSAQLEPMLAELARKHGVVWYYRENGKDDPSDAALDVIEQIVDKKLPVTLSSKPDFSDFIDAEGKSHPRLP